LSFWEQVVHTPSILQSSSLIQRGYQEGNVRALPHCSKLLHWAESWVFSLPGSGFLSAAVPIRKQGRFAWPCLRLQGKLGRSQFEGVRQPRNRVLAGLIIVGRKNSKGLLWRLDEVRSFRSCFRGELGETGECGLQKERAKEEGGRMALVRTSGN
jgi:hypothetical protein